MTGVEKFYPTVKGMAGQRPVEDAVVPVTAAAPWDQDQQEGEPEIRSRRSGLIEGPGGRGALCPLRDVVSS